MALRLRKNVRPPRAKVPELTPRLIYAAADALERWDQVAGTAYFRFQYNKKNNTLTCHGCPAVVVARLSGIKVQPKDWLDSFNSNDTGCDCTLQRTVDKIVNKLYTLTGNGYSYLDFLDSMGAGRCLTDYRRRIAERWRNVADKMPEKGR